MPRQARIHSDTGIYHVMMRGNDKRKIFLDDDDRRRFIFKLFEKASEENTDIYAYCLMSNHIHLLLYDKDCNIARLMKRINVSFAYHFNKKYKRVGHLFQGRFISENVDSNDHLLAAVRYIHNNPVKAGIASSPENYLWSTYNCYTSTKKCNGLVTDKILNAFSENSSSAIKLFIDFSSLDCDIKFIDFIEKSNEELRIEQEKLAKEALDNILSLNGLCVKDLSIKDNHEMRNNIIIYLKEEFKLSSRQIAAIINISKGTVLNILKKNENGENFV